MAVLAYMPAILSSVDLQVCLILSCKKELPTLKYASTDYVMPDIPAVLRRLKHIFSNTVTLFLPNAAS